MSRIDPEAYVERVLSLVERVPPGRVTTYGLIAEAVGQGGPRLVGRTMALHGGGVPCGPGRGGSALDLGADHGGVVQQHQLGGEPVG